MFEHLTFLFGQLQVPSPDSNWLAAITATFPITQFTVCLRIRSR
jgi:hypothetical protein